MAASISARSGAYWPFRSSNGTCIVEVTSSSAKLGNTNWRRPVMPSPGRARLCIDREREGDAANSAPQETAADRRDYPWLPSGSEPDSAPSRPTGGLPWCSRDSQDNRATPQCQDRVESSEFSVG